MEKYIEVEIIEDVLHQTYNFRSVEILLKSVVQHLQLIIQLIN